MKGRNPAPWIDGSILTAIRKKGISSEKNEVVSHQYFITATI